MKRKTLAVILNYNLPDFTDALYKQLKPFEAEDYEVVVLDNGSPEEGKSQFTSLALPENTYFGGGLVAAMEYVLENKERYDSLLFLNSDLSVVGYRWVKSLREVMFSKENIGVVSPTIIQQGYHQIYWPQMRNWCSSTPRKVKWVDFQAPLLRVELLEAIGRYPDGLWPGFGYDVYTGYVCEQHGYETYALDYTYAVHYKEATLTLGKPNISKEDYNKLAMSNMTQCFTELGLREVLEQYRSWGISYKL